MTRIFQQKYKIQANFNMANENIKNNLLHALEEVVEATANITETKGLIHQIDIDVLKDKIKELYSIVNHLDKENNKLAGSSVEIFDSNNLNETTPEKDIVNTEKNAVENITQNNNDINAVNIESPIADKQNEEPVINENLIQQEIAFVENEKITESPAPPITESNNKTPQSQPITLAEKFKKQDNSINEQIKANNTVRNEIITGSPIQNLKVAIGINDKFIFINELFKGQMQEYDSTISLINDAGSEASAFAVLNDMLQKFGTSDKTETRTKLERYIRRRFAK